MSRRIKDPKCKHARTGIVTSHPEGYPGPGVAHAAASTCDRMECIEDAIEWASMISGRRAVFVPDASRRAAVPS
jgi:hypothetical protein